MAEVITALASRFTFPMPKAEIGWTRLDDAGDKLDVYAQRVGGEWRFYSRSRRYEQWQAMPKPPLEDWMALLDAVRRRVSRRRLRPEEVSRVEKSIRERFPDADQGPSQR